MPFVSPLGTFMERGTDGLVFGNRGCLHDAGGRIVRHQATRRWIACRLEFKGRHREVMPPGRYTGLFFLDEATAFAAGHRPCAECRREDFNLLKRRWGPADAIDRRLQAERGRTHQARHEDLPDGAFVVHDDAPHLVLGDHLRPWTPAGYGDRIPRPTGAARLITPPSLLELLRDGWSGAVPLLHPSATS